MISKDKLTCSWAFWLSYQIGDKKESQYTSNLIKIHQLHHLHDFAYTWQQSIVAKPEEFFINPSTLTCNKFELKEEMKKIDSICLFKNDIEPTWQYGDNPEGGYYNFSFSKDTSPEIINKIYQNLVFMAIGNSLSLCERMKGIRIVDTVAKNAYRCRFELWMNYNQENLNQIKTDSEELRDFLFGLQIQGMEIGKVNFFNIGGKKSQKKNGQNNHKNGETNHKN